jgi:hypothetical protein
MPALRARFSSSLFGSSARSSARAPFELPAARLGRRCPRFVASTLARSASRRSAGRSSSGSVRGPNLVGEVELLERDRPLAHPQGAEVLAVAHHELRDRGQPRVLHRPDEQRVDLLRPVLRPQVVRVREEDRVDLLVRHEVGDLDRLVALDPRRPEVLVVQVDELALAVLEALDDLLVGHRPLLQLADLLVADRAVVLLVHEVEVELVLGDRAVEAHRHVDEAEGDGAGPEGARHARLLAAAHRRKTHWAV